MSDVQNSHSLSDNPIENFIRITHQRHDAHSWTVLDSGCTFRCFAYLFDHRSNARLKRCGNPTPELGPTVGRNFLQICNRAIRIFNLHWRRNVANATATSSSVATPLRSASSMALSSSDVG